MNQPTFATKTPLRLVELPTSVSDPMINATNSYLRVYTLGECSVIVTKEHGKWHLSIAHKKRYPTWDEIAEARYRIIPDVVPVEGNPGVTRTVTMAMLLPPRSQYVNVHPNCFQLHEIPGEEQ